MTVVQKEDPRWDELYGMALSWSHRSVEARHFHRNRDGYKDNLYFAPDSALIDIRRSDDNMIIGAAGVRLACEAALVEFIMTDPDIGSSDWYWLHRRLLWQVARFAVSKKWGYVKFSLFTLEEYQSLLASLSPVAMKSGFNKGTEPYSINFLFQPEALLQAVCDPETQTPA